MWYLVTVNTSTHIIQNSKYKYTYYQNTHTIVKTPTQLSKHPHIHSHLHITKQVKTTTVQDIPKWNSHNIIKYPQYKVTLMYLVLCPQEENIEQVRNREKEMHSQPVLHGYANHVLCVS